MSSRRGEPLGGIDPGALLDAAAAARIGVTVTFLDGPRMTNVYMSEAAADILGWPVEELLERDPLSNIAPQDVPRVEARAAARRQGDTLGSSYELTVVRKDGRQVPIEVNATRTTIGGRAAVVAFVVDVSARKEAEQKRLRNEARFRELFEIAPEPIGILGPDTFLYVNPAYVSMLGFSSAEELCATPISSLLEPEDVEVLRKREALVLGKGIRQPPYIYRARKKDGTPLLFEVVSVQIEYEGRTAALSLGRDVTLRKQLERQLVQADRLAALGTLAAGIAHEINNPIAYLMLNLEWIARQLPKAAQDPEALAGLVTMLQEAREGAARVSTIVRELRSFSRADADTRRRVDLGAVVQSAFKIVGNEVRQRARVATSLEPVRPVWASEGRLDQVVVNLVLNAAQAMPEGRPDRNEIRVAVRAGSDDRAVLEVWDNGVGIPPDVLPRIFDPFFTTKPIDGTGLGLSICHGIVSSLGGKIAAYSDPSEGTTFRVVLPTVAPVDTDAPASQAPRMTGGRRARVMVVDDELPIANTLRDLLGADHEVVATTHAREALARLRDDGGFDVVFCDLMMPEVSGMELYERVRAELPGLERRIVFMTGGAFTAGAAEFLASVENRRIEKPFSLGLIERIVSEMTSERSAEDGGEAAVGTARVSER